MRKITKKEQTEIYNEFLFESEFRKDEKRKVTKKKTRRKQTKKSKRVNRNKSSRDWIEKRKRTKVKTFPSKHNRSNFFYSNKKQFILDRPLKIEDEQDLELLRMKLILLVPKIYKFFLNELKNKRAKSRLMNIGYQIVLRFANQNKTNINTIITTSFLPTFKVKSKDSIEKNILLIIENILRRFEEYMNTGGFYSLEFYGLEAEIES